jgi:hypothetical protein
MVLLNSNISYITTCYIIIRHPSLSTLSFSSFVGYDGIALICGRFLFFFQALHNRSRNIITSFCLILLSQ